MEKKSSQDQHTEKSNHKKIDKRLIYPAAKKMPLKFSLTLNEFAKIVYRCCL